MICPCCNQDKIDWIAGQLVCTSIQCNPPTTTSGTTMSDTPRTDAVTKDLSALLFAEKIQIEDALTRLETHARQLETNLRTLERENQELRDGLNELAKAFRDNMAYLHGHMRECRCSHCFHAAMAEQLLTKGTPQ